ncbi:MAG TPA: hypothetical protein VEB43_15750 [Anaeromyxobacter sp.]|nr:hypothetical protein [Anaeromyxobacter sp.]
MARVLHFVFLGTVALGLISVVRGSIRAFRELLLDRGSSGEVSPE